MNTVEQQPCVLGQATTYFKMGRVLDGGTGNGRSTVPEKSENRVRHTTHQAPSLSTNYNLTTSYEAHHSHHPTSARNRHTKFSLRNTKHSDRFARAGLKSRGTHVHVQAHLVRIPFPVFRRESESSYHLNPCVHTPLQKLS